jgi:type VI secretion system protein ImpK
MREEISPLVHRIIMSGLELKERLARGDTPDFEKEQAKFKGLLGDADARRYVEFAGEMVADNSIIMSRTTGGGSRSPADYFLGIRYALVCWLDEIFILDSPWASQWNEDSLEISLYGMRDRAHGFWNQARRAETRSVDALEAYYLCAMLGFRGDWRDEPEKLQSWASSAHAIIAKSQGQEWAAPEETEAPMQVQPLRGREKMQKMVLLGGALLLLLILFGSFFFVFRVLQ